MKGYAIAILAGLAVGGVAIYVALLIHLDRRLDAAEALLAAPVALPEHQHEEPERIEPEPVVAVPTETIVVRDMVAIGLVNTMANIRAGQGAQFEDIGTVPANAEVVLIRCEQWCLIRYADVEGWVSDNFVKFLRLEQVE